MSEKPKLKKRKKRLTIILIILAAMLVLAVGAIEFTSHSGFCSSCHYMRPYFASWEESSHADIECSRCHYPPSGGIRSLLRTKIEGLVMVGRYWTKLYVKSKPWAEIRDESCLAAECHDLRLLEGQVEFQNVAFDHAVHFEDLKRGKKLQCTSCHSQIVQGEHITVTESTCFICHFKESDHYPGISDCNHCHTRDHLVEPATSRFNHTVVYENNYSCDKCHTHVITGDGDVPRENCYKCHWEQERLEKFDDTDLMHTEHIYENKIECNQCHMDIQHKIVEDIETISDCKSCHTDTHLAQKILYFGEGGRGHIQNRPNVMLEKGLSCKGCHMFHEESQGTLIRSDTLVSQESACESCHGEGYQRILKQWEDSTRNKLRTIRRISADAAQRIRQSRSQNKDQALALIQDALFNIEIVEQGKSVHNVSFSQDLLAAAYSNMEEAMEAIGSTRKLETFTLTDESAAGECANCHTGVEEFSSTVFGLNFTHKSHIIGQKIDCMKCHSHVSRHGETISTKQSCAGCHHQEPARDCASCHTLQNTLYNGGTLNGFEIPKDLMAEAEVECLGCHLNDTEHVVRATKQSCIDCHDEDYGPMLEEWQASIIQLIDDLQSALKAAKTETLDAEQKTSVRDIEQFLQSLSLDGSSGIHNYMFLDEHLSGLLDTLKNF